MPRSAVMIDEADRNGVKRHADISFLVVDLQNVEFDYVIVVVRKL
jgi:hypothetical protein